MIIGLQVCAACGDLSGNDKRYPLRRGFVPRIAGWSEFCLRKFSIWLNFKRLADELLRGGENLQLAWYFLTD